MKFRFLILALILPVVFSSMAWGADNKPKATAATPLFDEVVPLPGAFTIASDGLTAAHINTSGDILIWDASRAKLLQKIPAGGKKPSAIALNPDGSLIAIGYADARLLVRSVAEKKSLQEFFGHLKAISALAFSPDGQLLASGGDDGTTQLWEVFSGKRLHIFDSMHYGLPVSMGFSGNGGALIVSEWYHRRYQSDRGTTIWDVNTGLEISTRTVTSPSSEIDIQVGQALGGKGWLMVYPALIDFKSGLVVERLDQCNSRHQLLAEYASANAVAADPSGRWVAATGTSSVRQTATTDAEYRASANITFFSANNDTPHHAVTLPVTEIALVPHPDGRSVFALTRSGKNYHDEYASSIFNRAEISRGDGALYRIPVPKPLWHLPTLDISEDATHCPPTETSRVQQGFKVPETPSDLEITAKLVPSKEISSASKARPDDLSMTPHHELYFGQEGSLYALYHPPSLDVKTVVAVWDLQTSRPIRVRLSETSGGTLYRLKDGWGKERETFQNILTGKTLFKSEVNESFSSIVSDIDTGDLFRLKDEHIERYAHNGKRLKDVKVNGKIKSFAARNGRLAALFPDGKVRVWQLEPPGESGTYRPNLKKLMAQGGEPMDLTLSADGRYLHIRFDLLEAGYHYEIYHLSSGKSFKGGELLAPLPARANRGVVPDARGHRLAVWDYDKGEIIARLPRQRNRDQYGNTIPVRAAISDDGHLLASGSRDGLVRVWDLDAHQMVGESRLGGEVTALAFDPAGQQLAAARRDGEIVVFRMSAALSPSQ